jgi:hypothetical protein
LSPTPAPSPPAGRRRLRPLGAAFAVFLVALGLGWAFTRAAPVLNDTDSYYHLAVAREYARAGVPDELAWARFSMLRSPFPDKELLFHWALAPFAAESGGSSAGGRFALALLVALALGVLAFVAAELAGPRAAWAALALPALALDLPDRLNRLRPELVALVLFLLTARAIARRADRAAGLLGALFALSYTAIQAWLGLVALLWLVRWRHAGRPSWALPLYAGLGAGLGLVVHPAFPANLELWVVQNVHLFDYVASLGAGGAELRPATTLELLAKNFGFWAAAALALLAARRAAPAPPERALARDVHAVAALAFGALYLAMWRFGLYFFPFATLALLAALGPEGLGARFRWPARRTLPLALAWLLCVVAALPQASAMAGRFLDRAMPGPPREEAWRAFAASVPDGAKIAAPWGIAQAYVFFAPQGRYLNLLDPLLMALPYPREEALARALFAGEEPDLALAVGAGLDSDYLAFSRLSTPGRLAARAAGDPRLRRIHDGYDQLYALEPGAAARFARDWEAAAPGAAFAPYPRRSDPRGRELEAFVDARRVGPGCVRFLRRESADGGARHWLELAPYGLARLAVDGRPLVALGGTPGAVLGEGALVEVELAAGEHVWTLETCPDPTTGRSGFFLLERQAGAEPSTGAQPSTEVEPASGGAPTSRPAAHQAPQASSTPG